jgi:two-component system sensor histidine kinase UhpB
VAQEALTNVLKHAKASRVEVSLAQSDARLTLMISDNGLGRAAPAGSGRGLANMRARALRLGATLELALGEDGTRVSLSMPHPPH